jgi:hypothetical protein
MKNLWMLIGFVVLAGCASKKEKVELAQIGEGNWKAKSLITEKDSNRSNIVYLNFNAVRDQSARMDVSSSLGTGVASLVVDPKEVRYVLFDQKRYYIGAPQADALKPILALPFNPKWIHNILFEEAFTDPAWACTRDKAGLLSSCQDAASGLKVTWGARNGPTKSITIDHPRATVQINVQTFKPKLEERKDLFVLNAPSGYQKLRVR